MIFTLSNSSVALNAPDYNGDAESNRQNLKNRRKEIIDKIEKRKRGGKTMSIEVPKLANFIKCKVIKWHFKPGDIVTDFDVLCDIEYKKTTLEVNSEYNYRLVSVQEIDKMVLPGQVLCTIVRY